MSGDRVWPIFQAAPDRDITFQQTDFLGDCPVCGSPGGHCTGDSTFDHMVTFETRKPPGPDATFIVDQRIFAEQQQGSRTVRKLLYAVGDRITPEEAKRVGLI